MSQTPSRLEIAARIHHLLLRDLGQGIDIDQMLRLERYARDVLLVCDAYKGEELAELARKHNDANIICIPARFVRDGDAEKMLDIFMNTAFEGGRHQNRVDKIAC